MHPGTAGCKVADNITNLFAREGGDAARPTTSQICSCRKGRDAARPLLPGERKALSPESGRLLEVDLVLALHGREIKAVPHALANTVEVHFSAAIYTVQLV